MSLQIQPQADIPEATARVARAAFKKGNLYLKVQDSPGTIFTDEQFKQLFPNRGQPAKAPWGLALVTIFQFLKNLTDRPDAVRSRLDWKYVLALELEDTGFDYSVPICGCGSSIKAAGKTGGAIDVIVMNEGPGPVAVPGLSWPKFT